MPLSFTSYTEQQWLSGHSCHQVMLAVTEWNKGYTGLGWKKEDTGRCDPQCNVCLHTSDMTDDGEHFKANVSKSNLLFCCPFSSIQPGSKIVRTVFPYVVFSTCRYAFWYPNLTESFMWVQSCIFSGVCPPGTLIPLPFWEGFRGVD